VTVRNYDQLRAVSPGNKGMHVEVSKSIRRFGVFVAVPMESFIPLIGVFGEEKEDIVFPTFDSESEDYKYRVGEAGCGFDLYLEIRSVDAVMSCAVHVTLGLIGVKECAEL
jgi:hypothetical protein